MNLQMNGGLGDRYDNPSQKARVVTEQWYAENMFCPRCGHSKIVRFENNRPVADFYCPECAGQYEAKSKKGRSLNTIGGGAFGKMIERITSPDSPDFFFMSYRRPEWQVQNLFFVPKHFFTPGIVRRRNALAPTARRAGWVGCLIMLGSIPRLGRVPIVEKGIVMEKEDVLERVAVADALMVADMNSRGWLLDVLSCVESIGSQTFTLAEVYGYERRLAELHPDNHNIRAKIRQQLQMLRDRGVIEFVGRGKYRKK